MRRLTLNMFAARLLAAAALAAISISGASCKPAGSAGKIRIQLNWVPEPEFGGIYAAAEKGFFTAAGLDVEIIKGGAGTAAPQLIANGNCEFGVVSGDQILQVRESGGELVALYTCFQTNPVGLMLHEANPISSLEELWKSSSTVAIEPGLPYVKILNAKYGGEKLKLVPYQGALAIFASSPLMAQQCFLTAEPVEMELQKIPVKVFSVADGGFNPYTAVIATSSKYLAAHPETVKSFIDAIRKGWEAYNADPKAFNPKLAAMNPAMSLEAMNLAAAKELPYVVGPSPATTKLGSMTAERWNELAAQLKSVGAIKGIGAEQSCFVNP